jgi:hypothetical protein
MEARDAIWGVPALAGIIFFSSLLGLSGNFLNEGADALGFMGHIWAASPFADAMFILGTSLAAVLGYGLAERGRPLVACLAGALAHWIVYFGSFLLLPGDIQREGATGIADSFLFVGTWGSMGLIFAALVPPLIGSTRARRAATGVPA